MIKPPIHLPPQETPPMATLGAWQGTSRCCQVDPGIKWGSNQVGINLVGVGHTEIFHKVCVKFNI